MALKDEAALHRVAAFSATSTLTNIHPRRQICSTALSTREAAGVASVELHRAQRLGRVLGSSSVSQSNSIGSPMATLDSESNSIG